MQGQAVDLARSDMRSRAPGLVKNVVRSAPLELADPRPPKFEAHIAAL